jgi:hypothetical protein
MLYADQYLEKYANSQKEIEQWESTLDEKGRKERQLLRKYQQAKSLFEKNLLLKQLRMELRPVITKCVDQAGLATVVERDIAFQMAETHLKPLLDSFDLSMKNKLSTYLYSQLPGQLLKEKYRYRDMTSRRSEALTMTNQYIRTANKFLSNELDRKPTEDEIFNFVTDKMNMKIKKDQIGRNLMMDREEYNGNEMIGKGDDSNAEALTLLDIKHVGSQSPEQMLKSQAKNDKIDELINKFGRNERKMLRRYYGLGEFKGRPTNANNAATDSNMTYYQAKKVIADFEKMLDEHGF